VNKTAIKSVTIKFVFDLRFQHEFVRAIYSIHITSTWIRADLEGLPCETTVR